MEGPGDGSRSQGLLVLQGRRAVCLVWEEQLPDPKLVALRPMAVFRVPVIVLSDEGDSLHEQPYYLRYCLAVKDTWPVTN